MPWLYLACFTSVAPVARILKIRLTGCASSSSCACLVQKVRKTARLALTYLLFHGITFELNVFQISTSFNPRKAYDNAADAVSNKRCSC